LKIIPELVAFISKRKIFFLNFIFLNEIQLLSVITSLPCTVSIKSLPDKQLPENR